MNKVAAQNLAKYHRFTREELNNILTEALGAYPETFWEKPGPANPIFDNGAYFNLCVKWIDYKKGVNDSEKCSEMVSFRVLHGFGKLSKIQLPKKKKVKAEIMRSEKPKLN